MANAFYNPSGNPATGSEALSALMRAEFVSIGAAFDLIPQISTTGSFATVFAQTGNYTFTLPSATGTLATTANIATETTRATAAEAALATAVTTETTRATAAEGVNATAISTEATARATAITNEVTARNTAIGVETTRATTAEALLAPKASPTFTGTINGAAMTLTGTLTAQNVPAAPTWSSMTGSRALNTTYTNSRGYMISVAVTASGAANITVGGFSLLTGGQTNTAAMYYFQVPAGQTYYVNTSGSLTSWAEMF
jgi:hypothetical protein